MTPAGPVPAEADRATRLRRDFDAGFAEEARASSEAHENLLAVGIGGDPYALRLSEISELATGFSIVPFPTRDRAFLGVATLHGRALPVFGLAEILGYVSATRPRWIVLVGESGGLAFERMDGSLRARPRDFAPGGDESRPLRGVVRDREIVRSVLDVPAIERRIRTHARPARTRKEE